MSEPKTYQEMWAVKAEEQNKAEEQKAFYQFCHEFPHYALQANLEIFRDFLNGAPVCLARLKDSLPYVRERLAAKDQARIEQEVNEDRARIEQEAIDEEIERRASFVSKTPDELRAIIRRQSGEQNTPLPPEITPRMIKTAPPEQIRKWKNQYGWAMINLRLNSAQQEE